MSVVNTNAFIFYNKLLESYNKNSVDKGLDHPDNNIFVHSAINQAAANADNPFPTDIEAYQVYFSMMKHHSLWKLGGADRKISRRRFLNFAIKLAELAVENPFEIELEPVIEVSEDTISLEALAEAEYAREDAAAIASGTYVPVSERSQMFTGVFSDDEESVHEVNLDSDNEVEPSVNSNAEPEAVVPAKKPSIFKRLLNMIKKKEDA